MNLPNTPIVWVPAVTGRRYADILELVAERPIVTWFSSDPERKGIRILQKATARRGDDLWLITSLRGADISVEPRELAKVLRYLTPENNWTLCEFEDCPEFYRAALAYLEQ